MNRILKNTATVGAFTALSRVLGLAREMLLRRLPGAWRLLDDPEDAKAAWQRAGHGLI